MTNKHIGSSLNEWLEEEGFMEISVVRDTMNNDVKCIECLHCTEEIPAELYCEYLRQEVAWNAAENCEYFMRYGFGKPKVIVGSSPDNISGAI